MNLKVVFKSKNTLLTGILIICGFLCFVSPLQAQRLGIELKVIAGEASQKKVLIKGNLLDPEKFGDTRNWLFTKNYAEATDLAERIHNLEVYDVGSRELAIRKLGAGEYQANGAAQSFSYEVLLEVPAWASSAAHVSWLARDGGMLMIGDLLPKLDSSKPIAAEIEIDMPSSWQIFGSATKNGGNKIFIENTEKAVFAIGQGWREKKIKSGTTEINFVLNGSWQVSDDEAAQMAAEIEGEYQKIFGASSVPKVQIFLLPFPQKNVQTERWQAETRGTNVTIVSGMIGDKRQAIQRLDEQLRHEIFHLWLPNAVNLTGDYSWFYEGFAVYQALKTGVMMNQIRFEDFLRTLAVAYDLARNQKKSLLAISSRRWSGNAGGIYGKGMVVAFLCDARLLAQSGGKKTIAEVFRGIYRKHRAPSQAQNANQAILSILRNRPELAAIVRDYVEGEKAIEWRDELKNFGIEFDAAQSTSRLRVVANPGERQKDLLDKLGYNQWRKLRREN